MPLLEHEAHRLAAALDDYDDLSVADIGGTDDGGYWLVVDDERFDHRYNIGSHCDYWDFLTAFVRSVPVANLTADRRAADPATPAAASTAKATA